MPLDRASIFIYEIAMLIWHKTLSLRPQDFMLGTQVKLIHLDNVLDEIAAMSAFSSISLREMIKDGLLICIDDTLSRIFRALKSSEAKWMVRMLSKNYSPVCVPESLAIHQFHFLLPDLLKFQNSFEAAVKLLDEKTICCMPFQA
jgi:DNA ligase 4